MNCKPGDLAIVIRSEKVQDTSGAVVKVLRPYSGGMFAKYGPAWWIEWKGEEWHAVDAFLRPIRPGDISDEEVRDLYQPKQDEVTT